MGSVRARHVGAGLGGLRQPMPLGGGDVMRTLPPEPIRGHAYMGNP